MTRFRITLANTNSSSSSAEAPPPETATVESDMVVILAALICALICVVGFIAVAKCPWLRRSSNGSTRSTTSPASANKGLKKKILQSFPKFKYSSSTSSTSSKLGSECAICLSEFVDGDEVRVLPQCGHGFHLECIDKWLKSHSSCPSCRQILAVVRCQKCGQLPGKSGGEGGNEVEMKGDIPSSSSNGFLP